LSTCILTCSFALRACLLAQIQKRVFGQTATATGYQDQKSSPQIQSDLGGNQMESAHAVGQWVWDEGALELRQRNQLYLDPSKVHTPPALHSAAHSVMQVSE